VPVPAGSKTGETMTRTPRPRVFEYRLECNTTKEQSDAVDRAFPGQLADRATKIRLLVGMGLQAMGIAVAPRPAMNGHQEQTHGV
jgi:hypothetical protein